MSENKNVSKGGDKKPVVTVAKGGSSDKPKKKRNRASRTYNYCQRG